MSPRAKPCLSSIDSCLIMSLNKEERDCYMFAMEYYASVKNVYKKVVMHRNKDMKFKNINKQ